MICPAGICGSLTCLAGSEAHLDQYQKMKRITWNKCLYSCVREKERCKDSQLNFLLGNIILDK